jgi:hypothetical protein
MRFEKLIAGFLAALITAVTAVSPVLAATALSSFPTFLGTTGTLDTYVVVGKDADPSDVVGAVDVMARLAELSYTTTTTSGTSDYDGIMRDGISICTSATPSTGCLLSTSAGTGSQFPSNGLVKNFHYTKLKSSTFSWKSNDYNYHEQFDVSAVTMRHSYTTTNVNGTEKMVIGSGNVKYQYVFDKDLNMSGATTAGTTGTIASPEYTNPVKIKLLGKDFTIVGVGATSIKALSGSTGLADSKTPVTYGDYSVYAVQGSNGDWVKVQIKDKNGNIVGSDVVSITGGAKSFSSISIDVRATTVRALDDGTVVGADLVVGPTGTTEKEYDTSADTTSTGTASDKFTGETLWGIQISGTGWGVQKIPKSGAIDVVYKPTTTEYYKAGEKLTLPNDYGYLSFEDWNTDKFATVTIKPINTQVSAYNNSDTSQAFGSLNGIEISSDVSNSIVSQAGNLYDKGYILFNMSSGLGYPVMFGFYDSSLGKILVNGTFIAQNVGEEASGTVEYESKYITLTTPSTIPDNVTYSFKLNYGGGGEVNYYLNVTVNSTCLANGFFATNGYPNRCGVMSAGTTGSQDIAIGFGNKTQWTSTSAPEFRLGGSASSAEDNELNATSETVVSSVGKASQEVVDDSGLLIQNPGSNGASDQVVVKVPGKILAAKVYVGKKGATTGTGTIKQYASITSAVAKLDTEITATEKAKNIVSVGGPGANRITAEAMGLTYPTYGSSGLLPFAVDQGYIAIKDGVFTAGKAVVIAAGWEAAQTRTVCTVLQQYDTLLAGQTASAVIVTSATTAGITPVTTTTTTTAATTTTTA